MRLVLIRHGQTPSNVLGLLDTVPPGPGLTELGTAQAAAVPETVRGEPIEAVYASTATRARETAAPLAGTRGLEVIVRAGLREIAAGDWEMRGDDASVTGYLGTIGRWMAGRLDERTPGPSGESGSEVLQRFDAVVAEVAATGVAGAALVAHGAINRFWASVRCANLDDEFGASHALRNTGIVVISGAPASGWTAQSWTGAPVIGGAAAAAAAEGPGWPAAGSDGLTGLAGRTGLGGLGAPVDEDPVDEDPFDEQMPVTDRS